jgi:hypothetical protein
MVVTKLTPPKIEEMPRSTKLTIQINSPLMN